MSENGEMTVAQAEAILRETTPQLNTSLQVHMTIQRAIQTLVDAAKAKPAKAAK